MSLNLIVLPTLTPAQETLLGMQQLNHEALRDLASRTKRAFDLFWRNDRATPQEIAAALGTNAAAVFDTHAATVQFLLGRDPTLLSPEDYTPPLPYQWNADGSMTLL